MPATGLNPVGKCGKAWAPKEAIMEESKKFSKVDYGCESRCVEEFVECIETEDGAHICKTRERNCFAECKL
jgi:hypothetical protein